jgi:hypothetical protein
MNNLFTDQPELTPEKEDFISQFLTNWQAINTWLSTSPDRDDVIRVILYESKNQKRAQILDRLLGHFYKREKAKTLAKLVA